MVSITSDSHSQSSISEEPIDQRQAFAKFSALASKGAGTVPRPKAFNATGSVPRSLTPAPSATLVAAEVLKSEVKHTFTSFVNPLDIQIKLINAKIIVAKRDVKNAETSLSAPLLEMKVLN